MGNGRLEWHTKRAKDMRMNFKNYALALTISAFFIFFNWIILLLVLWDLQNEYFRYCFLLSLNLMQVCLLPKINEHVHELEEQVQYRITRYKKITAQNLMMRGLKEEVVKKALSDILRKKGENTNEESNYRAPNLDDQ